MSKLATGILAALAVSMVGGAVQLASGHDLIGRQGDTVAVASLPSTTSVNRAGKRDRDVVSPSAARTKTIVLRLDSVPDTSVLVRVPLPEEARSRFVPRELKPGERKASVGCEPLVSPLTEVAKRLQPGRCLT